MQFKADLDTHSDLFKYGDIKCYYVADDGIDFIAKSLTLRFITD